MPSDRLGISEVIFLNAICPSLVNLGILKYPIFSTSKIPIASSFLICSDVVELDFWRYVANRRTQFPPSIPTSRINFLFDSDSLIVYVSGSAIRFVI